MISALVVFPRMVEHIIESASDIQQAVLITGFLVNIELVLSSYYLVDSFKVFLTCLLVMVSGFAGLIASSIRLLQLNRLRQQLQQLQQTIATIELPRSLHRG